MSKKFPIFPDLQRAIVLKKKIIYDGNNVQKVYPSGSETIVKDYTYHSYYLEFSDGRSHWVDESKVRVIDDSVWVYRLRVAVLFSSAMCVAFGLAMGFLMRVF